MLSSLANRLTFKFYKGEKRCRGWFFFIFPFNKEPPFVPFFFHAVLPMEHVDDGKRPTIFTRAADLFKKSSPVPEEKTTDSDNEINAYPFLDESPLHALGIALPKGEKIRVTEMEQLLLMLSYSTAPVSFEIIATQTLIRIQFVCREPDSLYVQSQLKAYFPNCVVTDRSEDIFTIIPEDKSAYSNDYGLKEEFMRPLGMAESF